MEFLRLIWKQKYLFFIVGLLFFITGYFISEKILNPLNTYYSLQFTQNESFDENKLLDEEYYLATFTTIDEYNSKVAAKEIEGKKISYANIDYEGFIRNGSIKVNVSDEIVTVKVKASYFPTILKTSSTGDPNFGYNRFVTYFKLVLNESYSMANIEFIPYESSNLYKITGDLNSLNVGLITLASGIVLLSIFFFVLLKINVDYEPKNISDNETIFKHPFKLRYWKYALKDYKSIRSLSIIAMLFAMMLACKALRLPSGFGELGISPTFIFFAIIAMLYGPVVGLGIGVLSDVIGFLLFPTGGVFNFGYTLNALLSGFAYGIGFYRTKITFVKCFFVRMFVNIFVNAILGSLWWAIIYNFKGEQYLVYFTMIALPKNLIYLLPQSIVLYLVFKALGRVFKATNLLSNEITDNISLY